jgi:hypothetical protein
MVLGRGRRATIRKPIFTNYVFKSKVIRNLLKNRC